jgi:hypothetical protein
MLVLAAWTSCQAKRRIAGPRDCRWEDVAPKCLLHRPATRGNIVVAGRDHDDQAKPRYDMNPLSAVTSRNQDGESVGTGSLVIQPPLVPVRRRGVEDHLRQRRLHDP